MALENPPSVEQARNLPNTDAMIEAGRLNKSANTVYLGLVLASDLPLIDYDNSDRLGVTRQNFKQIYPGAEPFIGDLFDVSQEYALKLGRQELRELKPQVDTVGQTLIRTLDILFSEGSTVDNKTASYQADAIGTDRFKRLAGFSDSVKAAVLEDTQANIPEKDRDMYPMARTTRADFQTKALFTMEPPMVKGAENVQSRAEAALAYLTDADKKLAVSTMETLISQYDATFNILDEEGNTVDPLTSEEARGLQFLPEIHENDLVVKEDGHVKYLAMSILDPKNPDGNMRRITKLHPAFSYTKLLCEDRLVDKSWYGNNKASEDTEAFFIKYTQDLIGMSTLSIVVSSIDDVKKALYDFTKGKTSALPTLQETYVRLQSEGSNFFQKNLEQTIKEAGTLPDVSPDLLYLLSKDFKNIREDDVMRQIVESMVEGKPFTDDKPKPFIVDYLTRRGFTWVESKRDRRNFGITGDVDVVSNETKEDMLDRLSRDAVGVSGRVDLDKHPLVWGGFPVGEVHDFTPQVIDPEGAYVGISYLGLIDPLAGGAYIPLLEGTRLTDIALYDRTDNIIPEEKYFVEVHSETGRSRVMFNDDRADLFSFRAEVEVDESRAKERKDISLDIPAMNVVVDELKESGLTLLARDIQGRVAELAPGETLSVHDLATAVKTTSNYSFDSSKFKDVYGLNTFETLQRMSETVNENGMLQIQCDGAYAVLSSMLKLYFEETRDDTEVMPQFSFPNVRNNRDGMVIFSAITHAEVALIKHGEMVAVLDGTPDSPIPLNAKMLRKAIQFENLGIRQGNIKLEKDNGAQEEAPTEDLYKNLMEIPSYGKWVKSLSDTWGVSYFAELPFIAIPKEFERQSAEGNIMSPKQKRELSAFIKDQKALLDEYKKGMLGDEKMGKDRLPEIPHVSDNVAVIGTLTLMLGKLGEMASSGKGIA